MVTTTHRSAAVSNGDVVAGEGSHPADPAEGEGGTDVREPVERKHPGWYPSYSAGGTRARRDAGFFAVPWKQHRLRVRRLPLFGVDAAELSAAIEAFESREEPCR